MAVNLIKVDYEAIPRQAMSMRSHGKELNNEITEAYSSIREMHKSWYGQRYNALVKEFKKIIPNLNELLELVINEIPVTLENIANNYALADKGASLPREGNQPITKIGSDLEVTNDVGMRFIEADVTSIQEKISKNFQHAIDKMNTIESEFSRITWESEASEVFKARFKKLKGEINQAFINLESQFKSLMEATKEDIKKTEDSNTVQ